MTLVDNFLYESLERCSGEKEVRGFLVSLDFAEGYGPRLEASVCPVFLEFLWLLGFLLYFLGPGILLADSLLSSHFLRHLAFRELDLKDT